MNTAVAEKQAKQHHLSGQLAQAESLYAAILNQEPDHVESLHWLGMIAHEQGDSARAIDLLSRAAATGKANATHWNNLGVLHASLGNADQAVPTFEAALRLQPDHADAHNNLGVLLHQRGQSERAVEAYRNAIRCRPTFAEAYKNLGNALKALDRHEEAVAAYGRALAIQPDYAEAFNSLGVALEEQGKFAPAVSAYREALRLRPSFAAASNNLAAALKEQGLLDESLLHYRETLRLQPDHAVAWYNLSQFFAEGRYTFQAAELERIKARMTDTRTPILERSLFAFTLGTVFDKQGAFDEAFACFRLANELRGQVALKKGQTFDASAQEAFADRLIATFDRAYFQRVQGWGDSTELPIFVIGMPRSGSTLVEQIVSSHPAVHGTGELWAIPRLVKRRGQAAASLDPKCAVTPWSDSAAVRHAAADYLQLLTEQAGPALRIIDKTLENFLHLGVIATLFPRARIIHCRRDPLDICLSCYFQNFQSLEYSWTLEDIGAYYVQYERLMAHWRQVLPLPIHEVCYEELIAQQEPVTRDLLAYCGLDWDERCLAFHNNRRAVRTASTLQVRKPLSAGSIGRWRRYRAYIDPLLNALGATASNETGVQMTSFGKGEVFKTIS